MEIDFSQLDGQDILVTGASGLIGSEILKRFIQARKLGHELNIFALSKSSEYSVRYDEVRYLTGDLSDCHFTSKIRKFDSIIHAAGYGQPGKFLRNPFTTISLNTTATEKLLQKASNKFLFVSTSEIYSGSPIIPCKEDQTGLTNTNHPRAAYIESKKTGETLTHLANKELGINSNIARLALAYGPGARLNDERVLNQLIIRSLKDQELRLQGSGDAIRTYCYISDAVDLLLQVFLLGSGEIYNIGGNSRTTINELAGLIANLTGANFYPENKKVDDFSPAEVSLDITKVIELSGKKSFIQLEEGLKRTISWYQNLIYVKPGQL
jgi:nucleoside-diphosphate-sugar epimerase